VHASGPENARVGVRTDRISFYPHPKIFPVDRWCLHHTWYTYLTYLLNETFENFDENFRETKTLNSN
jgi:hypothetical protein